MPKSFLNNPEIKKYQRIDRYIHDYYQVIASSLKDNFKIRQGGIHKNEPLIIQASKHLNGKKVSKYWDGYPGKIDVVAEKNDTISFFEIKTNNSQLSDWQKLRIILLQRENIRATPVRVHLYFSPIVECETSSRAIVRVPFKKKFAFGILFGEQNSTPKNCFLYKYQSL